ncbi:uncharacterized protein LOC114301784 [Camellia sinensis]|uniref:uncharacterized protein LOC114301784 n=1 Tax=Camellia sinensis TaxID=4442 RepID=UPI001036043A|nr:uncharacterized protein LOC114301784 [Camellia sinensis]
MVSFTEADLDMVQHPNNDDLVVSLKIGECQIKRILIDQEIKGDQVQAKNCSMAAIKSTCNVRETETVNIEGEDMEVLDDVGKEPVDKSEKALKKILIQQGDEEHFFLLGSGLTENEEKEFEAFLRANIEVFSWTPYDMPSIDPKVTCHRLNIDRSSNRQEAQAGVMLVSQDGRMLEQSIRLGFKASNNKVEYEVLIAGLKLAAAMKADEVVVFCDFQLIVNQAIGEYTARDERMIAYVKEVVRLLTLF